MSGQVQTLEAHVELAQVVLAGAPQLADPADRSRRAGRVEILEAALDRQLALVRELVAVAREELDAVVVVGVVGGGDHNRQVEAVASDQQRRGRGGQHTPEQRVATGGADTGGDRRLEHLARLAGVADDQHLGALGLCLAGGGTSRAPGRARRSGTHRQRRERRRSRTACGPCSRPPLYRRGSSAWRTAASYGPSSARPSCAPWRASRASGSRDA